MPAIPMNVMPASGQATVTRTTLTGTGDTFTYIPGAGQVLILHNPTAGAISPVIDGAGGTTVVKPGIGQLSVAAGYAVGSIAEAAQVMINCDKIGDYLQGVIAITSATGLVGSLIRPIA